VINKINKEEDTTIFLTSHDIGDIEWICHRIIIINYWKILFDWDIKDLKKHHMKKWWDKEPTIEEILKTFY
jgi:ABC-2 type transport system ATP-binding protein